MTELLQAMEVRHSVRQYIDKPLTPDMISTLEAEIELCNKEGGLHLQLVKNEPKAFDGFMAHYGKFSGVQNYLAVIGPKTADLEEKCGYYGERIVLKAQMLGLNSCWVGMTYSKTPGAFQINSGEKLIAVIALGYGKVQGNPHKSKAESDVISAKEPIPDWFKKGVAAALLAPSSMNQQKFKFILEGSRVRGKTGLGFNTKVDLGIAKYHFEIGAGKDNFSWA